MNSLRVATSQGRARLTFVRWRPARAVTSARRVRRRAQPVHLVRLRRVRLEVEPSRHELARADRAKVDRREPWVVHDAGVAAEAREALGRVAREQGARQLRLRARGRVRRRRRGGTAPDWRRTAAPSTPSSLGSACRMRSWSAGRPASASSA